MGEFRAQYPSTHDSVGPARRAIMRYVALCGFHGNAITDIESAIGEALANAAEHGRTAEGHFGVEALMDGDRLVVTIKDEGVGFERWNATQYIRPLADSPRGFGIFIMRELMDEVEFSDRGSRLKLVKRLPAESSHGGGNLSAQR